MTDDNPHNMITSLYTDIKWMKTSLQEIKETLKKLNENQSNVQQRLTRVETKVNFHDKIIYAVLGATITGFLSITIWIITII